jgi:photosystem II stability/assembly factor-like uncharacterized protein
MPSAAQWVPLGPDGGDARSLAYDSKNPDHIFLGTSSGQLYVSNDSGRTWARHARLGAGNDYVLDNIEIDPVDPQQIFVAAWSVEEQVKAGDVFRSRDGGKTWQALAPMHGKSVRAMAVAPSDHRIIVVGALDGVFRSNDSGDTWERISPANHAEIKNIESIAIDPRDPKIVYAGTWHLAWKTNDGGLNWHPIKNGVIDDSDVFSIIVDHKNSSVVYLSACSGIYKSEMAAELFHKIQGMPFSARRTRVLQQDPNDTNIVYAGTTEGLWKTVDAGKTWKRVTEPNIIVNDVMVDPRQSSHVLLATDRSGVLSSTDGTKTFVATNRGFAHRQVSTAVVDENDTNTIYAGVVNDKEFGGVFVSKNGGSDWRQITDGLAGKDVFTLGLGADGTLIAGTNQGIYALNRGQVAWRMAGTAVTEKQVKVPPKTKKGKAALRTEFVKSEISGRVNQIDVKPGLWFAAASSGVYKSSDNGKTWRGGSTLGESGFLSVQALSTNVVAATLNAVIVSKDSGASWTKAAVPQWVKAIFRAAIAPDAIWLATREGALRSMDGGATWEHVLGGLPSRNIFTVGYDTYGRRLLATASTGQLFESRDSGNSWQKIDSPWQIRNVAPTRDKLLAITAFDGLVMKSETKGVQSAVNAGSTK